MSVFMSVGKKLAEGAQNRLARARDTNYTTDTYHGSTHDLTEMDASKTNVEGDWGQGIYSSSNIDDVNENYAGVGPDLTARIEQQKDRLQDDILDEIETNGLETTLQRYSELLNDSVSTNFINDIKKYRDNDEGFAKDLADIVATKQIKGSNDGVVYPLKQNTEGFATIGGKDRTVVEGRDYHAEAREEIKRSDYGDEYDYEDAVEEYAFDLMNSDYDTNYQKVLEVIDRRGGGVSVDDLADAFEGDSVDLTKLDEIIRKSQIYAEDDAGNFIPNGAVSAEILQNLGFKGVIDNTANAKFGSARDRGRPMDGMDEDTVHYITFKGAENQIRSRNAQFKDPTSKNILAGSAATAITLPAMFGSSETEAGVLSQAVKSGRERLKAYHGSPHDFDEFSTEAIGTGEGAQAYGHGLYFAEREGTAKSYRDALSGKNPSPRYKGKGIDETDGPTSGALSLIKKELLYNKGLTAKQAKEQAITSLNVRKQRAGVGVDSLKENQIISDIDEKIRLIESMDDSDLVVGGRLYEVDIDASPDELLDYDLPLSQQSDEVKKRILDLGLTDLDGNMYTIKELDALGFRGQNLYEKLSSGDDARASARLKDVGIKGIKYADAQTRFSSKGKTHNYVMFDDNLVAIARKYGVSMPVAGAILAGTMTPEQAQAGVVTKAARESMLKFFDQAEVDNAIRQAGSRKSREALTQMPIDDFLALAREGYSPAKAAGISDVSKFDDLPFLNIRSEDGIANITGHEGRHRARRLKELGESTVPVRIKSDIRWDQQDDPTLWDYEQDYPQILFNEDGTKKSPFPFVQGDSNLLDSSALNIEDIPRKTTPTSTSKQIDDDELLKSLFGGSAATAVSGGALFSPDKAQAGASAEQQKFERLEAEEQKLRAMRSSSFGKVSSELAAYRRSQLLPSIGTLAQGAARDTAKGLDYISPANLTRLLLDPADEGFSRFMAKPITDRIAKGAEVVTQPMLYDEDDPYSKKRKQDAMDLGGMLFSPL